MSEIKISELTSASTPVGTEVLAIVQSNDTKKTTINSLATALEDNLSTGAPTWTTDGILTAGYHIIAGGNHDGRVALTINDGYGNANITFNHTNGIPDRSGSSARIVSSVDSNQEVLDFQLKGGVIAGSSIPLTSVLKLFDDKIQLLKPTTLSTSGTTTTSLVNKGYIDSALNNKADINHTHNEYALSSHLHDGRYSQLGHTHTIANITNLQNILNGKIGETEINSAHFTFANNTLSLKTIQEGQIATDAITTTKIEDGNVTAAKLSSDALTAAVAAAYPVGSIYINATNATNPATLLGFGTWVAFGAGRVLIGEGSDSDDQPTPETVSFTAGDEGGEYNHTLTTDEMPSHKHFIATDGSTDTTILQNNNQLEHYYNYQEPGSDQPNNPNFEYALHGATDEANRGLTSSFGNDEAHNNLQPYIVVHMWKRTA